MATIKPFLFTGEAPVSQPLPTVDPQRAAAVESTTASGYADIADMFGQNAGIFASHASAAMNSYYNNSLQKKLADVRFKEYVKNPEIIDSIAKEADNETLLKLKMVEAKRLEDLPKQEMNYLDTTAIKMQEDYMQAVRDGMQQADPNGKGYIDFINKFFNDATVGWMEKAPSETSATEMMSKIQDLRLRAMDHGMKFEEQRRQDYALVQANEAGDSLIRQAIQAPENLSAYIAQGSDLKEMLIDNGIEPAQAQKWESEQRNKILAGYMSRRIMDDPVAALGELTSTDIIDNMAPESIISTISQASNAAQTQLKEQEKAIKVSEAVTRVKSGLPLRDGVSEDLQVADEYYKQLTSQFRDSKTGSLIANEATPEVIFRALKDTPNLLPAQAKTDIVNGIAYGTPDVAAGMAQIVKRMTTDPGLGRVATKFDDKELQMGVMIADAVNAGASPTEAVQDARKRFLVSPGSMEAQRNKEADAYLSSGTIKDNLEGVFSSWLAPLVGINEWFLGHGYSGEGGKFHDPDNLAIASNEYSRLYRQAYLNSGDQKAADAYAITQLQKSWASTTVNGAPELMQYAPNIVYPGREHDFTTKFQDAAATVRSQNPELGELVIDSKDYFGTNYAMTEGSYPVYQIDKNGQKRPLLGPNGLQMRFDYSNGLTPEERDAVIEARKRRQSFQDGLDAQKNRVKVFMSDLMKSKSVTSMNAGQRLMVRAALWALDDENGLGR